jgi:hypothetical protein
MFLRTSLAWDGVRKRLLYDFTGVPWISGNISWTPSKSSAGGVGSVVNVWPVPTRKRRSVTDIRTEMALGDLPFVLSNHMREKHALNWDSMEEYQDARP